MRTCKHVEALLNALVDAGLPVPEAVEPLADAPGCGGDPFAYGNP